MKAAQLLCGFFVSLGMRNDEILDLPRAEARPKWLNPLFYAATALLAYYVVADWMSWPLAAIALLAGLASFGVVAFARFIRARHDGLYPWFYLLGHLTLLTGIGLYLLNWPQSTPFFWAACACFAAGLIALNRRK